MQNYPNMVPQHHNPVMPQRMEHYRPMNPGCVLFFFLSLYNSQNIKFSRYAPIRGYHGHVPNYPRPPYQVRGYGQFQPNHRPRHIQPYSNTNISAIYHGVAQQVGTG